MALTLNPDYVAPVFNLGLTYQQTNQWERAIRQYRAVTTATSAPGAHTKPAVAAVAERVKVEALIRECDLLQALGRVVEAEPCWALATQRFPSLAGTPSLLGRCPIHALFSMPVSTWVPSNTYVTPPSSLTPFAPTCPHTYHAAPHNELGNLHGRAGRYELAAESYRRAVGLGSLLAELNLAHMLELQGFYLESR